MFNLKRKKLSKCSSCKIMHYCSVDCQKFDWKIHKFECQKFFKVKFNLISDDQVRLYIRILIRVKNKEADITDSKGLKTFKTLMDRMFHLATTRFKNIYSLIIIL